MSHGRHATGAKRSSSSNHPTILPCERFFLIFKCLKWTASPSPPLFTKSYQKQQF